MRRQSLTGFLALAIVCSSAVPVLAQSTPPTSYTFVAEWRIPRPLWAGFTDDFEKNTRPTLEKLATAGTLTSWGVFESIVHTEDGYTHGVWWSSSTLAGIENARTTLVKAAASSASLNGAVAHRDYMLRSLVGNGKPASGTDGYLSVSSYLVKAGQGDTWRELWDKYSKPVFEDIVAKGLAIGYSIDVEDVHTESPNWRHVVTVSTGIEMEDKIGAAFDAASAKRTPEERKTMTLQVQATLEPGTHRDQAARIIRYWQK